MTAELGSDAQLEIGHALFMDIVGYAGFADYLIAASVSVAF